MPVPPPPTPRGRWRSTHHRRSACGFRIPAQERRELTEVPAFANTDELSRLLEAKSISVNARAPDAGKSALASLLVTLLPMLLFITLLVWLFRRAAGGA